MTYNVEETEVEERNTISTGNIEIDRRIGGGIPYGTLMLIEGDDASGKSSITHQLFYGALKAGEDVVCYSTETTIQSLIPQMKSIGMDCTDYFIMNHLRIFPISTRGTDTNTDFMFDALANHIEKEQSARVLVIDSLTTYISSLGGEKIQDFFQIEPFLILDLLSNKYYLNYQNLHLHNPFHLKMKHILNYIRYLYLPN